MRKFLTGKRVFIMLAMFFLALCASSFVFAQTPPLATNTGITIENPLGTLTFEDIIGKLIDFLLTVALIVCPLMIVIGGFFFITAAGSPEKANKGRQIMIYAVIGLVIILISKGLVAAVKTAVGVK